MELMIPKSSSVVTTEVPHRKMRIRCSLCDKMLSCTSAMYRHIRTVHKKSGLAAEGMKTKNVTCRLCSTDQQSPVFTCHNGEQLRQHLTDKHSVKFQVDNFVFASEKEFANFKQSVETSNAFFVKLRGSKRDSDSSCIHETTYFCNRSGFYKETLKGQNRKRTLKLRGTGKINTYCPAKICVQRWKEDDEETVITVEYTKTHVGHSTDDFTNGISSKDWRSNELQRGVGSNSVSDGIRQIVAGEDASLIVTVEDLEKLADRYMSEIRGEENDLEHRNEEDWVEMFVDRVLSSSLWSGFNPILLSRLTGTVDVSELNEEDFLLVIMNERQKEVFLRYGSRLVAVDSSLVFTENRFKLITIMVLDEKNRAILVALVLSSRVDESVMILLFRKIKEVLQVPIHTSVFVSDDVDTYFNAWRNIMGEVGQRWISTWHVDKTWRQKLVKVKDSHTKISTYKAIYVLLTDKYASSFERSLPEVAKRLRDDPKTSEFGTYFSDTFVDRSKLWANCYRNRKDVVGNIPLENLHEALKYFVAVGIKAKRLDRSIVAIMSLLRDRFYERLIDVRSLEANASVSDAIKHCHAASVSRCEDEISRTNDETWLVRSSSDVGEVHTVVCIKKGCGCGFVCVECRCCIHEYSCNCLDSCLNWNMCRHIHLVVSSLRLDEQTEDRREKVLEEEEEIVIHCRPATEQYFTEVSRMKGEILKRMEMAMVQIQAVQKKDTLVLVEKLLHTFTSSLDITLNIREQVVPQTIEPSSSSRRDYSRKKKWT